MFMVSFRENIKNSLDKSLKDRDEISTATLRLILAAIKDHDIQFRTTLEINYKLKNNNRIGISIGHISNANLGNKNPGVEIISLNYQVPY